MIEIGFQIMAGVGEEGRSRSSSSSSSSSFLLVFLLCSFFSTLVTTLVYSVCLFLRTVSTNYSFPAISGIFSCIGSRHSPASTEDADADCLFYEGKVWHERRHPILHLFDYSVRYAFLNLDFPPGWFTSASAVHHMNAEEARIISGTTGPVYFVTLRSGFKREALFYAVTGSLTSSKDRVLFPQRMIKSFIYTSDNMINHLMQEYRSAGICLLCLPVLVMSKTRLVSIIATMMTGFLTVV